MIDAWTVPSVETVAGWTGVSAARPKRDPGGMAYTGLPDLPPGHVCICVVVSADGSKCTIEQCDGLADLHSCFGMMHGGRARSLNWFSVPATVLNDHRPTRG